MLLERVGTYALFLCLLKIFGEPLCKCRKEMILFYFPPKHFAMTIKRDSDGNKKHKMFSAEKERENASAATA